MSAEEQIPETPPAAPPTAAPGSVRASWPRRLLMFVTDRTRTAGRPLPSVVAEAVEGGVNAVQIREKDLPAGALFALARQLRGVCGTRALLLINDRVDVALLCGADGVHLTEGGLPVSAVRKLVPPSMLVGKSVHTVNAARQAEQDGADYVVIGTVFPSRTHPDSTAAGPELLRNVASRLSIPVVGVGGIDAGNLQQCIDAGADGVAVISAIGLADDPQEAARSLCPVFDKPVVPEVEE